MSVSMLPMMPSPRPPTAPRAQAKACPFASNCTCVFAGNLEHDDSYTDEVNSLVDSGWSVVSADASEVILERRPGLPFCWNLSLVVVTGFLWLIYWIPRMRHPKIERKVVSLAGATAAA
jgi:hypothetical protein